MSVAMPIVLMIRDPENLHLTKDIHHIYTYGVPGLGTKIHLYMARDHDGDHIVKGDHPNGKTREFIVLDVIHLSDVALPVAVQVHVREIT